MGLGKESGHMVAAPIRALEVRLVEWDGDSFQPCEVEADGTLIVAIGYDTETLGTVSGEIATLVEVAYPDECNPWDDEDDREPQEEEE